MSRLPSTFTSLYRLFLRTTSASVLHYSPATRNLRQLWRPVFVDVAQNIKKIQDDATAASSRREMQKYIEEWESRMDNTLKFLYTSATSRGLSHRVIRNLSLLVLSEYQRNSVKLPVWNPRLAPDSNEYSIEMTHKNMNKLEKRQHAKEFDKKAVNALDQMSTTTIPFTSNHYVRDLRMTGVGNQMRDKFVEPTLFLEEFLPIPALPVPEFGAEQKAKFRKASEMSEAGEIAMYEPFILATTEFCPTLSLSDTHKYPDDITWVHQPGLIKPDICARLGPTLTNEATDISTTELCLRGSETPFKAISRDPTDVLAQLATYAGAQLASQPRTHCFSIHFTRHHVRLFRWDRSGAIVTRRVPFAEETYLVDSLWRYSHAARQDQGYDPFVTEVGEDDGINVQNVRSALKLDEHARIWRFQVTSRDNDRFFYGLLIPPRHPSPCIPTGRCTQGSPVVDENGELAYLKETWRGIKPHAKIEGEVYETLHAASVSNIPTVIASGDAKGKWQCTVTEVERVPTLLHSVPRSRSQYVDIPGNKAHHDAYARAGILHCDVSLGNIFITKTGGLLIDWDLSKNIREFGNNEFELTGTWQFISARLLSTRTPQGAPHMLADDLESFYHVLCYLTLLSGQHNLSPSAVFAQISDVYNDRWVYRGRMAGGTRKIGCFKDR
uniref:Fungal-type protein kinase domain-containing protein n=1 Tax=Moniliophthora roreri TaxID=221103 RepID=A0A0W0F5P5_MONRR